MSHVRTKNKLISPFNKIQRLYKIKRLGERIEISRATVSVWAG